VKQMPTTMRLSLLATILSLASSLPAQDTTRYTIVMAKGPAGYTKAWTDSSGARRFYSEWNDRGRGPAISQRVVLGRDGYPVSLDISGVDYLKSPVTEHYVAQAGSPWRAAWKNDAESTSVARPSPAFYLPMNDISIDVFEPLLLKARKLPLLPQGEARVEKVRDIAVAAHGMQHTLTLNAVYGFGFTPNTFWSDEQGNLVAFGSSWWMTIREGFEGVQPALLAAQAAYDSARGADLARRIIRTPAKAVAFRNATLFDADAGTMRPHTTVVVSGNRIVDVGDDASVRVPRGAEIVDVAGRTLMPGLWDMHVHLSDDDGLQHLAAGVTSVRDLANDVDETLRRLKAFNAGTLIGPRMLMAGFMDGPGPYAGPTKVLVSTPDSARAWVNRYADLGYQQIKVYSSLDTALVPVIIAEAHKRGLRVSGHVPNGMTAEEFVRAGADELQHVNFLFLNFWRDSVKDTRTPERFTAPAQRAALLDLQSERVQRFIRLLHDRGTVIDPTVVTFEGMLAGRPGKPDAGTMEVANRMPPVIRRSLTAGGGLPVPDSLDQRYKDSFVAFGRMVKAMYDGGVKIVAGTDGFSGFALHRELEIYSAAGIPNTEVLRIATINAARVMKRDAQLGSIAPGKLADLIIVDGRPDERMSDIRRVVYVMKDGKVYDPAAMYQAVGVTPIQAAKTPAANHD